MTEPTSDRARRAEEARRKILASGDQDLINRLHLLEAAGARAPDGRAAAPPPAARGAPGLLGTGLAVAGGAWLGTVLAGMTLSGEMQEAFAAVADDLGIDPGGTDLAALDGVEATEAAENGGFLDDMGLGDIGDVFDV